MKIEGINLININFINEFNIDILYFSLFYMFYFVVGSLRFGSFKFIWNFEVAFCVGV